MHEEIFYKKCSTSNDAATGYVSDDGAKINEVNDETNSEDMKLVVEDINNYDAAHYRYDNDIRNSCDDVADYDSEIPWDSISDENKDYDVADENDDVADYDSEIPWDRISDKNKDDDVANENDDAADYDSEIPWDRISDENNDDDVGDDNNDVDSPETITHHYIEVPRNS